MSEEDNLANTSFRKLSHLEICLKDNIQSHSTTGFEDFKLIPRSLCNMALEQIDTSTYCFGKQLAFPLLVAAMTGGHPEVRAINEMIAKAVSKWKIAMGVGSQRAAIEQKIPYIRESFQIVRELAPNAVLLGNLGIAQLGTHGKFGMAEINEAISMIQADAIALHSNPAQELVQMEGDTSFHGFLPKLKEITAASRVPIILKEVGSGFSREDAYLIADSGIAGIDIGGLGGTSWVAVESQRALQKGSRLYHEVGKTFWDWGIPTAISLVEVRTSLPYDKLIIATGGIRTGLDAAKAIALGADLVGIALPFLKAAHQGSEELDFQISKFLRELQIAMMLTGCKTIQDLRKIPVVVTAFSHQWLTARGMDTQFKWRKHLIVEQKHSSEWL